MSITTYVADTYEIMKKCKIYIKIQKIRRKYGIEFQMKGNRCIDTYNMNLEHQTMWYASIQQVPLCAPHYWNIQCSAITEKSHNKK